MSEQGRNQYAKLYGRKWRKARAVHLAAFPLCVMCQREGRATLANVVDHIREHKGDPILFWDRNNWQSLCTPHHDITKQRQEKTRLETGVDANGRPLSKHHPWNAPRA